MDATIGVTIGAAVTATGTTDRIAATHTVAPAGDGHPRAAPGCAVAPASPTGTAIIEGDGITTAVDTAVDRTVVAVVGTAVDRTVVGGPSAERERLTSPSNSPAPGAGEELHYSICAERGNWPSPSAFVLHV
jgi:hypothetical protein